MLKMKRLQEFVIAILAVGTFGVLLWQPLTSDTKPCSTGDSVPSEPRSEDRRVHSENGFSIVSPVNWMTRNSRSVIRLTPIEANAGQAKAGIVVVQSNNTPDDFTAQCEVEFLGQSVQQKVERHASTFDDLALTTWTYCFQRDGLGYKVSYFIADEFDDIPELAMQYLEYIADFRERLTARHCLLFCFWTTHLQFYTGNLDPLPD